jgi:predicted RND superfamily exporter protein
MKRFAEFVLAWRWPILVVFVAVLAFSIYEAKNMRVNNAIRIYFISDDPNLADYDRFEDTFGGDEFVVIALKDERGVFNTRDLEIIRAIGQELKKIDGVSRVTSITDSVDIWGTEDGIVIEKLIDEIPRNDAGIAELRRRVFSNPLFIKTLISDDSKTALITARLNKPGSIEQERPRIVGEIRAVADKYEKMWGSTLHVAGVPVLNVDMNVLTFRDLNVFIPLTIILNIFVLYLTMGRWSTSIISTISMASSVVISVGIYNALGFTISLITTMVPPLIMVIGVSDSIHITNHYLDDINGGMKKKEALVETMGLLGVSCFMTSFTTIAGFSSFLLTKIVPLREIALFAGLGLLIAYSINVTFVPIALSILPTPKPLIRTHRVGSAVDRITAGLCRFDLKYPVRVLVVGALFLALSVFFITRIKVETQNLEYLKESQPLRKAYTFIEKNLGFISPVVVIEGGPGSAHDPATLREVDKFQRFVLADPNVSTSAAATDLIKRLNMAFFNNDPDRYSIPETREGVAQLLLLYETSGEGELDYFVDFDASTLRVSVRAGNLTSNTSKRLMEKFGDYFAANLPEGVTGRVTGTIPLYVHMVDYIIRSQITSFSVSFLIIFLVMGLQLWSFRLGLISIVPNIVPVAMTMGAMGLFGINLDIATVMIASIATGIAVDDTIHFLNRFRHEVKGGATNEEAITTTLRTTGKAAVITSVTIVLGFWCLLFASFRPTIYFGFLSGITMITAIFGDLILLPAGLITFLPKKKGAIETMEPTAIGSDTFDHKRKGR